MSLFCVFIKRRFLVNEYVLAKRATREQGAEWMKNTLGVRRPVFIDFFFSRTHLHSTPVLGLDAGPCLCSQGFYLWVVFVTPEMWSFIVAELPSCLVALEYVAFMLVCFLLKTHQNHGFHLSSFSWWIKVLCRSLVVKSLRAEGVTPELLLSRNIWQGFLLKYSPRLRALGDCYLF